MRIAPAILVAASLATLAVPGWAVAAHPGSPVARPVVDLSFTPSSAMVGTTVTFRSVGRPASRVAGRTAFLQVDAGASWRTVAKTQIGSDGTAQAGFTSSTTGTRRYRVAVRSAGSGTILATSAAETVTWQKVTWSPRIVIAKGSAPVGENVPYTVTVQPTELSAGRRIRVQVKGRVTWQTIDTFRLNSRGTVTDDVTGYAPGLGRYRVQLLSTAGAPVATSPVASVAWS